MTSFAWNGVWLGGWVRALQNFAPSPSGLFSSTAPNFTDYVGIVAMSVIAVLPVIVFFMLARRRLLESIMLSGDRLVG